jgi:hypothetical protein
MKLSRRAILGSAIAIVVALLLIFLSAPNTSTQPGSTYSRAPNGYGAWYAYMLDRKFPIQRWEKPLKDFLPKQKGTLLRIFSLPPPASDLSTEEKNWIAAGNTLVQLGISARPTAADFYQSIENPAGIVQIETTRRLRVTGLQQEILGDRFGAIVRQEKIAKGNLIQVSTPYLAANAYQDAAGNYALLAQLVKDKTPIWIDEYLHGYKDKQSMGELREGDWVSYLIKTPLLTIAVQGIILLCVVIWSQNQRFGLPREVDTAKPDNSKAYIHSLAMVLARAGASEFVMQVIGQSEKMHLQKKLGLGTVLLSHQELLNAWVESGRPQAELAAVLEPLEQKKRISERQLLVWLEKWQSIN